MRGRIVTARLVTLTGSIGEPVAVNPAAVAYVRFGPGSEVTRLYFGDGSEPVTVRGKMADIVAALDGSGLADVLRGYADWAERRADQSLREETGDADADEWALLDDEGCDLARRFAAELGGAA